MNANQYDAWVKGQPKPQPSSQPSGYGVAGRLPRIMPMDELKKAKMKEDKGESRLDRILKPYRGRSYEGPTEPEVV